MLSGGSGNDTITVGLRAGSDKAFGGDGNDKINAQDAAADTIDCGAGFDTVAFNATDQTRKDFVASNCEKVILPEPGDV